MPLLNIGDDALWREHDNAWLPVPALGAGFRLRVSLGEDASVILSLMATTQNWRVASESKPAWKALLARNLPHPFEHPSWRPTSIRSKDIRRRSVVRCSCSYLLTGDAAARRREWDAIRDSFREDWAKEFGGWPVDDNKNPWPGHHIHDLARGGDPTASRNVIPARDDVHRGFTSAYEQCYKGGSQWSMPGPDKPYRD
ncbi:MAG: hypothetical protein JXB05_37085 [Myxococcaceae bacterium]|nr:hypothetical protein [Myxococcaceae bacterium]